MSIVVVARRRMQIVDRLNIEQIDQDELPPSVKGKSSPPTRIATNPSGNGNFCFSRLFDIKKSLQVLHPHNTSSVKVRSRGRSHSLNCNILVTLHTAHTTLGKMSSLNEPEERQGSSSSEAVESTPPSSPVKDAWKTVKTSFKGKSSMPELRRWWSTSRASESMRYPQDQVESLFCESLLGLMRRSERFRYLGLTKDNGKDDESANDSGKVRHKRFSWTR